MIIALEVLGILCMLTIMFVLIWGFILFNQILNQLRYKNYLMEKLIHNINYLSERNVKVQEAGNAE
ncbi:MAG: hypothetical protein AB9844_07740 [Clostridiaceae bacterium]